MAADLLDRPAEVHAAPSRALPSSPLLDATPAPAPPRRFAGFTLNQLGAGVLIVVAIVWAMWATRQLLAVPAREKIVTVRLSGLVTDFVSAAARSGEPEAQLAQRTQAYMVELQKALNARSDAGEIVLVGEAVVSSSVEDITPAIAAEVAKVVPFPVPAPASNATAPITPGAMPAMPVQGTGVMPMQAAPAMPVQQMAAPAPAADPTADMAFPFGSAQ